MPKPTLPPVDVWRLLSDGLGSPLRYGIYRAYKYSDEPGPTEAGIDRIVEQQEQALMTWFAETFRFNDDDEEEAS